MKANKHLSITERKTIENLLNCSYSLSEISKTLSRPLSTISRDIEKHKLSFLLVFLKIIRVYITIHVRIDFSIATRPVLNVNLLFVKNYLLHLMCATVVPPNNIVDRSNTIILHL